MESEQDISLLNVRLAYRSREEEKRICTQKKEEKKIPSSEPGEGKWYIYKKNS